MKVIADNSRVIGLCQGEAVIGKVLSSRLYGKRVVYSVLLDNPISLRWRTDPVYTILMGHNEMKSAPL